MKRATTVLLVSLALASAAPTPTRAQEPAPDAPSSSALTARDQRVLDKGPYSRGEIVGGGLLGTVIGLGTGHAVQGRYRDRGWIYTVGEVGAFGMILAASACPDGDDDKFFDTEQYSCVMGVGLTGLVIFAGFRVAEAVDVWVHPVNYNRRYRELKAKADDPQLSFHISPNREGGAAVGLALRF